MQNIQTLMFPPHGWRGVGPSKAQDPPKLKGINHNNYHTSLYKKPEGKITDAPLFLQPIFCPMYVIFETDILYLLKLTV